MTTAVGTAVTGGPAGADDEEEEDDEFELEFEKDGGTVADGTKPQFFLCAYGL